MAQILEMKAKPRLVTANLDVSSKLAEIMHALLLLDHAVLNTTYYRFHSAYQRGCRTWSVDGVEVNRDDFEEHLTAWLLDRAARRVPKEFGVVLPMCSFRHSAR